MPLKSLHVFLSLETLFSLLQLISLNYILSPSSLSFLSCRYNIMTQCWQQNPEDRPTFFQLADKLKSHHERMKCASVCIDDDLSDIEEEGEFKRGDSNRSWLRGSLRDSMRRIRTSIHRQNSLRAIRRQSSFKSDTSGQHNNGQVSSSSADNLLESVSGTAHSQSSDAEWSCNTCPPLARGHAPLPLSANSKLVGHVLSLSLVYCTQPVWGISDKEQ